ncbi:cyclin family protein [Wolffia australiana]
MNSKYDSASAQIDIGRKPSKRVLLPSISDEAADYTEEAVGSAVDELSSSSSSFPSEITSKSASFYARSKRQKNQRTAPIEVEFRPITRSYAKRREKLKALEENGIFEGDSAGNSSSDFTTSEITNVSGVFCDENRRKVSLQTSDSYCPGSGSLAVSYYDSRDQDQCDLDDVADFSCSESLSDGLESSPGKNYHGFLSGYSSSLVLDSSDDCSETRKEQSAPSFLSVFLRLGSEFCPSGSPKYSPEHESDYAHEFTLLRFADQDDEESYEMFRRRERNQAILYDYTEGYELEAQFRNLVIHQRLVIVNWMVEFYEQHANKEELQCETLFLAVSLLDRVLCKGSFKAERHLQLLGIACLILAIRLEENQPYNCVRRKFFHVGENTYSRCEVVAMEWFVQEVLKFQCLHLTSFNFLWFYLKAARADAEVENLAKYLAVISLLDHERLAFWPSTVAAGVVILASLAAGHDDSCNQVMETHVRTRNDDLSECIESLKWLVKYAN